MPSLSIVIPVYNEKSALKKVMLALLDGRHHILASTDISDVEMIVVNDGSTDGSEKILSEFKEIRVIHHHSRLGYGRALKTGFANAKGDLIGFIDADDTYPMHSFVELYYALIHAEADLVVGSRFLSQDQSGFSPVRYIGNKIFAVLAEFSTGKKVSDATSGMRLFRVKAVRSFYSLPDGLDFTLAMTVKSLHQSLKITEAAIPYNHRTGGSKLSVFKDGARFFRTILFLTIVDKPYRIFTQISLLFFAVSLMFVFQPLRRYIVFGVVPDYYIYRLIFVTVMLTLSVNLFIVGFLTKNLIRPRFETFRVLSLIGITSVASGILLNFQGLYEYLTSGSVDTHWTRPLIGGLLVLSGFQFYLSSVFLKTLAKVRQNQEAEFLKVEMKLTA